MRSPIAQPSPKGQRSYELTAEGVDDDGQIQPVHTVSGRSGLKFRFSGFSQTGGL
jgi:hypothetical protein